MLVIQSASCLNPTDIINRVINLLKRSSVGAAPHSSSSSYTHAHVHCPPLITSTRVLRASVNATPSTTTSTSRAFTCFHTRLPRQLRLLRLLRLQLQLRRLVPRLELRLRLKLLRSRNGLGERRRRPLPRTAYTGLLRRSLRTATSYVDV